MTPKTMMTLKSLNDQPKRKSRARQGTQEQKKNIGESWKGGGLEKS